MSDSAHTELDAKALDFAKRLNGTLVYNGFTLNEPFTIERLQALTSHVQEAVRPLYEQIDGSVSTVYRRLLWRHMEAARLDFDGPDRARIYELIQAFRVEFPAETAAYEEENSVREPS